MNRLWLYGLSFVAVFIISEVYEISFWVLFITLISFNIALHVCELVKTPRYDTYRDVKNQETLMKLIMEDFKNGKIDQKEYCTLLSLVMYAWCMWSMFDSFPDGESAHMEYERRERVSEFFKLYHLRRDYRIPSVYVYELFKKHFLQKE